MITYTLTFTIIDWLLFILVCGTVLYLSVFAIASLFYKEDRYPKATKNARILVLIPAYAEDAVIDLTVMAITDQSYPHKEFDVVVISDHMQEMTNFRLAQYPITVLTPDFQDNSSKARSLNYAMQHMPNLKRYDIVVVLDADNMVDDAFLAAINNAYQAGIKIVQAHRIAKNLNTPVAILDSVFEEINNSIFRKGHVQLGFSCSLVGSGIGYDYEWFRQNVSHIYTTGEDKEFEALLFKQGVFIDYLDGVYVYDEKTQKAQHFNSQRRRWMGAQLQAFRRNIRHLPKALWSNQRDYADKIIQWALIPRILMMALIAFMCISLPFFSGMAAVKWYVLGAYVMFIYALCIPDYLINKDFNTAMLSTPRIMLGSVLNLFRLRGLAKHFLHTEHRI